MPKVSIIICSLGRQYSFNRCIYSIEHQGYSDYEIIVCSEKGNLVELKEKGWRKAKGSIIVWLDDDVVCGHGWLQSLVDLFTDQYIVGVTGPTFVPFNYRKNRDIFKDGLFKKLYNWFFLENMQLLPGKISRYGVNTYGANFMTPYANRQQEVDFLEPPQFAIRRDVLESIGGFDTDFEGVAEWCDVDLCYRVKAYGSLIYSPKVKVLHLPVQDKAIYNKRLETASRYRNYVKFAKRWVKPSLRHYLYRLFLKCYFFAKARRLI